MDDNTSGKGQDEMLSQRNTLLSLGALGPRRRRDNKQLHYQADPHLQLRRSKRGGPYYTFRRGEDKEIYLGSAEFILKAVTIYKRGKGKHA